MPVLTLQSQAEYEALDPGTLVLVRTDQLPAWMTPADLERSVSEAGRYHLIRAET
jgi:hypothetical protein